MPADSVFEAQRCELVDAVRRQGIQDEAVLNALASVPREKFVSPELSESAYRNCALPIAAGQTISQPYIVALMAETLDLTSTDRVLDIGTGSGYAAAVMASIVAEVYSVECVEELAEKARARLRDSCYNNVHVRQGDGTKGWPEFAPYDAVSVAACGRDVPAELLRQLRVGGRLVMPIGAQEGSQKLIRLRKTDVDEFEEDELASVRFVPLIDSRDSAC